jgi:hypothetical protein
MRVAVCVSGQQRPFNLFSRKQHEDSMKHAFRDVQADYFYHTWNTSVLYKYENMIIEPEPVLSYHPVYDTTADAGSSFAKRRLLNTDQKKLLHASKQILAHSSLVKRLKDSYDVIVRCRWDLYFSDKVDYKSIIEKSYNDGPIGMGYPKYDKEFLHNPKLQKRDESNIRWWKMISPDNLIFHKAELWNTDLVEKLHAEKNLLPAEWGWYQILCAPFGDHHYGYKGGVICTAGVAGGWKP